MALCLLFLHGGHVPDILFKVFLFLSAASDTIDALVYLFLKAEVRNVLRKMLKFYCIRR